MNPPHPTVVRVEKEHNYARPWYRKANVQQKYPNRLTHFLYLRNFPRHFLSKYPNAFATHIDGGLDVGGPEDLSYTQLKKKEEEIVKDEPMETDQAVECDLNEQENKQLNNEGEDETTTKPEEPAIDTSTWTQQMDRLYYRTLQIMQEHYLNKLVHEGTVNEPIKLTNLIENTSLQMRHSFGNIAGWDNELLIWLHNLFTTKLPMHEHLIETYHEVMQYLIKRLPKLIEKFYPSSCDKQPSSIATTPLTSAATTPVHPSSGAACATGSISGGPRSRHSSISHHHPIPSNLSLEEDPAARFVLDAPRPMPRRLSSNPLILLVPSGPSIPSQPQTARMEYWKSLLSSMGQLINVNIPYRPEQTASEVLTVIKTSVRDKIRDTMKKKFNEMRPLFLVGFNHGSLIAIHCALDNPAQVSAVVCLGFPSAAINGFRGDLDDPMLDMSIPILFVVGQMASTATLCSLERLRESMSRSDTGLVVVGGANDKLIMSYKKRQYDGVTQYHVDKSISEEVFDFINSINLQPLEGYEY